MSRTKLTSKTHPGAAAGLLVALSLGLAPGVAHAGDTAPPRLGAPVANAVYSGLPHAGAAGPAVDTALLVQVKSRGRSGGRGNRLRSRRGGKSAFGRHGRNRIGRHYRSDRKYRAHSRYRYHKRRNFRPFRFPGRFRGRVEECYTGRLIYPDRYACGHPYDYHFRK